MKFENKNILIISPESWDHIFVSKHHYAIHLAKRNNKVFFLNPPKNEWSLTRTAVTNLFLINYDGFPRGLRLYPSFLQRKIMSRFYDRIRKLCSADFDVIWSFDNSVFFDFSAFPAETLKICHIVDLSQDFQTRRAASTADFCFCTSEAIRQSLARFSGNVFKIGHGFNPSFRSGEGEILTSKAKSRAVYAGNLAIPYIDWILLWQVVRDHSDMNFVFIGPHADARCRESNMDEAKKKVVNSANAVFPGKIEQEAMADHYAAADILLVAYDERFRDQVSNPHKMMEYLGSGKVVVATHTAEYVNRSPLIVMSGKNSEWAGLFKKVASDLAFYNSPDLQCQRRTFAMGNSYDEQITRIEKIIS